MRTSAEVTLPLRLDRDGSAPLPEQLADQLRGLVGTTVLAPGDALPSTRALAAHLGVSRGTVVVAWSRPVVTSRDDEPKLPGLTSIEPTSGQGSHRSPIRTPSRFRPRARPALTEPASDWTSVPIQDRYQVIRSLGAGGMGEVYEVEHIALGRRFALKRLRPELCRDSRLVERFRLESRVAAALNSEHVVSIVDSGMLPDGAPYFVMERLVGQDLRFLLKHGGPLPPARVAAGLILRLHPIVEALAAVRGHADDPG